MNTYDWPVITSKGLTPSMGMVRWGIEPPRKRIGRYGELSKPQEVRDRPPRSCFRDFYIATTFYFIVRKKNSVIVGGEFFLWATGKPIAYLYFKGYRKIH